MCIKRTFKFSSYLRCFPMLDIFFIDFVPYLQRINCVIIPPQRKLGMVLVFCLYSHEGSLLYYGETLWSTTSEKVWICHDFDRRSFVQVHIQDHWKKKRICVRSIPFLERNIISSYFSQRLRMTWECVMIFKQVH